VLGWGVGGIEAEAGMLGQPSYFPQPEVIGVKFTGSYPQGTTATDLALKVRRRCVISMLSANLSNTLVQGCNRWHLLIEQPFPTCHRNTVQLRDISRWIKNHLIICA